MEKLFTARGLFNLGVGMLLSLFSLSIAAFAQQPADDDDEADEAQPVPAVASHYQDEKLPSLPLTRDLLYRMVMGEIAAQRANWSDATKFYSKLARDTKDPRLIRRALEVAMRAKQNKEALSIAQLWVNVSPEQPIARRELARQLLVAKNQEAAMKELKISLSLPHKTEPEMNGRMADLLQVFPEPQPNKVSELLQPYKDNPFTLLVIAQAFFNAKDYASAANYAQQFLDKQPNSPQGTLLLITSLNQTDPEHALADLRKYVKENPRNLEMRFLFARMLTEQNEFDEALEEYSMLLQDNPNNGDIFNGMAFAYERMGNIAHATAIYKSLLDGGYGDSDVLRLQLGRLAEENKKDDEALAYYRSIASNTSGNEFFTAQVRVGVIMARHGRADEALTNLQQLASVNPEQRTQLLLGQMQVLSEAKKYQAAYDLAEKELKKDAKNTAVLYDISFLAEKIGRVDLMESYLRRLIALQPLSAQAYNALGYTFADRNIRLDEAYQLIRKALSLEPTDPGILDSMGWVIYRQGNAKEALPYLERAYRKQRVGEIAAHLGEVLWALNRKDEASKIWQEASARSPDDEKLQETMKKYAVQ